MRLLTAIILILNVGLSCPAGRKHASSRTDAMTQCITFDEYGNLRFKDERPRLDNYAEQLTSIANASALVVVYTSDKVPFEKGKSRAVHILDYLINKRGADFEHIAAATVENGNHKTFKIKLFICPPLPIDAVAPLFEGKTVIVKGAAIKKRPLK